MKVHAGVCNGHWSRHNWKDQRRILLDLFCNPGLGLNLRLMEAFSVHTRDAMA